MAFDHIFSVNDILYTPVDLPKIEPDSWEMFWKIWEADSRMYVRLKPDAAGNNTQHPGWNGLIWNFEIPGKKPGTMWDVSAKNYKLVFPKWYEQLQSLPFKLHRIQMLSNYQAIIPHRDGQIYTDHLPFACDLRTMLVDENTTPSFWVSTTRQEPIDKFYVKLPNDTNTFVFNNPKTFHGADYHGKRKIILTYVFDELDENKWQQMLLNSWEKYRDHGLAKVNNC